MYLVAQPSASEASTSLRECDAPSRLDTLSIVVEIVEDLIIGSVENGAGDLGDIREDVTSRRSIFTTL